MKKYKYRHVIYTNSELIKLNFFKSTNLQYFFLIAAGSLEFGDSAAKSY